MGGLASGVFVSLARLRWPHFGPSLLECQSIDLIHLDFRLALMVIGLMLSGKLDEARLGRSGSAASMSVSRAL